MKNEISLLKNSDNKKWSDLEWVKEFYYFLQGHNSVKPQFKLSKKKAFEIIYYLQERFPVIPDHLEQCNVCGELFDSYAQGHHSELTTKFYCSESCEPVGLYEREQRAEKRADTPFQKWLRIVKKEQKNYPLFKGKEINENPLRRLFNDGKTPIEALNDLSTTT